MGESLIAALLSGGVAIAVCLINNIYQQRIAYRQHEKTISLIEYKIDELTKRVDKHNNVIDRMYMVEKRCDVYDEKFKKG